MDNAACTETSGRLYWVLSGDFNHPNPVPCGNFVGVYPDSRMVELPPLRIGEVVAVWDGEGNSCKGTVIDLPVGKKIARVNVDYDTWVAGDGA